MSRKAPTMGWRCGTCGAPGEDQQAAEACHKKGKPKVIPYGSNYKYKMPRAEGPSLVVVVVERRGFAPVTHEFQYVVTALERDNVGVIDSTVTGLVARHQDLECCGINYVNER